jgi:hypothetical protein
VNLNRVGCDFFLVLPLIASSLLYGLLFEFEIDVLVPERELESELLFRARLYAFAVLVTCVWICSGSAYRKLSGVVEGANTVMTDSISESWVCKASGEEDSAGSE